MGVGRAYMTEQGLAIITVVVGTTIVVNVSTAISATERASLHLGEIVSASIQDQAGTISALTVVRKQTAPIGAGNIQLDSATEITSGDGVGATELLIMQCRAGGPASAYPMAHSGRAAMTEKGLAFLTIIRCGAITAGVATTVEASLRANLGLAEIVSAYYYSVAGAVTALTVVHATPTLDTQIQLYSTTQIIKGALGDTDLAATDTLVMVCRAGTGACSTERAAMTEKGLAEMIIVFTGGATGAASTAIAASMRASLDLFEILSAYIHDRGTGAITALTPTRETPAAANEIQLDSSTSFIRGTGTPAHDIPADDQVFMHVRLDKWA